MPQFDLGQLPQVGFRTAVERVRTAGGHADEPVRRPFGLLADCADDQGVVFRLRQPADWPKRGRLWLARLVLRL